MQEPLLTKKSSKMGLKTQLGLFAGTVLLVTLSLHRATVHHHTMLINFPTTSSVLPTSNSYYQVENYPGISDADQSPQLPAKFVTEEALADKEQKRMMSQLERQSKMEDGIDKRVSAIGNYVDDEMGAIARDVKHMNVDDSSEIEDIVPQQGPEGLQGQEGHDGYDGEIGLTGPNGLRGADGPQGLQGERGPAGDEGERGREGHEGQQGFHGSGGTPGYGGDEGSEGNAGAPSDWESQGAECARGATATMKLTDCNKNACRLETLYNGVWGSVCGEHFGKRNTRTLCKALGFPGSGVLKKNFMSGRMYTGSKGHVWLSNVQCKGTEGDVADCKHKGFGNHKCGHYNEVGICCKPRPWGTDPTTIKLGVRKGKSEGKVPRKFMLPPGAIAAESTN